jgi:hypothetical protein
MTSTERSMPLDDPTIERLAKLEVARLEAKLDAILEKIDFGDRSTLQVVKLHEERVTHLLGELAAMRADISGIRKDFGDRIRALEDLRMRLVGVAVGASLGGGGLVAFLERALR